MISKLKICVDIHSERERQRERERDVSEEFEDVSAVLWSVYRLRVCFRCAWYLVQFISVRINTQTGSLAIETLNPQTPITLNTEGVVCYLEKSVEVNSRTSTTGRTITVRTPY